MRVLTLQGGLDHRGPWAPKEHEEGSQKHRPPDDGEGTCLAEHGGGPGDHGARGRPVSQAEELIGGYLIYLV